MGGVGSHEQFVVSSDTPATKGRLLSVIACPCPTPPSVSPPNRKFLDHHGHIRPLTPAVPPQSPQRKEAILARLWPQEVSSWTDFLRVWANGVGSCRVVSPTASYRHRAPAWRCVRVRAFPPSWCRPFDPKTRRQLVP